MPKYYVYSASYPWIRPCEECGGAVCGDSVFLVRGNRLNVDYSCKRHHLDQVST
mgnify:CR=1 FL=1